MEARDSAPAPLPNTSGSAPSTVDAMVIMIGRKRVMAASCAAARTLRPASRNWSANSTIKMLFLAITPTSSNRPIWL